MPLYQIYKNNNPRNSSIGLTLADRINRKKLPVVHGAVMAHRTLTPEVETIDWSTETNQIIITYQNMRARQFDWPTWRWNDVIATFSPVEITGQHHVNAFLESIGLNLSHIKAELRKVLPTCPLSQLSAPSKHLPQEVLGLKHDQLPNTYTLYPSTNDVETLGDFIAILLENFGKAIVHGAPISLEKGTVVTAIHYDTQTPQLFVALKSAHGVETQLNIVGTRHLRGFFDSITNGQAKDLLQRLQMTYPRVRSTPYSFLSASRALAAKKAEVDRAIHPPQGLIRRPTC